LEILFVFYVRCISRASACLSDRPDDRSPDGFIAPAQMDCFSLPRPRTSCARRTGGLPRQGPTARTTRSPSTRAFPSSIRPDPRLCSGMFWATTLRRLGEIDGGPRLPDRSRPLDDAGQRGPCSRCGLGAAQAPVPRHTASRPAVDTSVRLVEAGRDFRHVKGPGQRRAAPASRATARRCAGRPRCRPTSMRRNGSGRPGRKSYGEGHHPAIAAGASGRGTARTSRPAPMPKFWAGQLGG